MRKIAFLMFLFFYSVLFASIPQNGAELTRFDKRENSIEINFNLPNYKLEKIKTPKGIFVKITSGALGYSVNYGEAELPTASFSLMLNSDNAPEIEVVSFHKEVINLNAPVYPVQKPWPKSRKIEDRPFIMDSSYYGKDKVEFNLISLSKTYTIHGEKGITVTIHPFKYFPAKNKLEVYTNVVIKVKNVTPLTVKSSPVFERFYSKVFLNYFSPSSAVSGTSMKSTGMGKILIITPSKYKDLLSSFVSHKESMGFTVDVFTLDETGVTKEEIRDFIVDRYSQDSTKPDFLILIGDVEDIPAFRCNTTNYPYSDLYYGAIDGDDYFPDIAVGRISITSEDELKNAINKIIYMENDLGSLPFNGLFITADDNYQVTETTHNYVIEKYFQPEGYDCEKIYMHTTGASVSQIAESINDGKVFLVYSGHGSPSQWYLSSSVTFTSSDVKTRLTNDVFPFVFSFACQTGEYEYFECFAEAWIRAEHGACAFWGSSVYSYWDEDDVLERSVFKSLFEDRIYQVGPAFNAGKVYLYNYYNGGGSTLRYFQQYNLFGDPSVYTRAYFPISKGQLFFDKELISCDGKLNVEVWDSDLKADSIEIIVTDLSDEDKAYSVSLVKSEDGIYSGEISLSSLFGSFSGIFKIEYIDENYGNDGENSVSREVYMDCDAPVPVYFNSESIDSTSGKLTVKFNEKCSDITLKIYDDAKEDIVKEWSFSNTSNIETTIKGLEPDTSYVCDILATDIYGNTYSQSGVKVFTTPLFTNLSFNHCDDESDFTHYASSGNDVWSIIDNSYAVSSGKSWFGQEMSFTNLSYLVYGPISLDNGDYVFSFYHTYCLESGYDCGIVEISIDGGNTFFDAGAYMLSNSYSGVMQGGVYQGRMAFTGGEFGEMQKTVINLSPFKGHQVYIRFVISSDYSVAMEGGGWYIDDISIDSIGTTSSSITQKVVDVKPSKLLQAILIHENDTDKTIDLDIDDNIVLGSSTSSIFNSCLVNVKPSTIISVLTYEDASVLLELYNSSGEKVAEKNIVLNKNSAIHTELDSLFENLDLENDSYTLLCKSTRKVALFEMDDTVSEKGNTRDWTEACYKMNQITLPVPYIASEIWNWDTFIAICNSGDTSAYYGMSYDPLGVFYTFENKNYNRYSSQEFNVISSIFNNSWPEYSVNMGNVYALGDNGFEPVCGTETFRLKDKTGSYKLTLEQNVSKTLFASCLSDFDNWWTEIIIVNPDMENLSSVEIVPYDNDGNVLDDSIKKCFIDPGEKYVLFVKDEFPSNTAWLAINSDIPIMGYEVLGGENKVLLAGIDLISQPSALTLLPVVDNTKDWTNIILVNPYAVDNKVVIKGYYNGEQVFNSEKLLSSYEKWEGLLSEFYKGNVDLVEVSSNLGTICFCLEGDSDMTKVGGVKGFALY